VHDSLGFWREEFGYSRACPGQASHSRALAGLRRLRLTFRCTSVTSTLLNSTSITSP
jgi:hypothetical protein